MKELNTMDTFGNGFRIERSGKIFTLTEEEMSDFRYLDQVITGKRCLECYSCNDDEKEIIDKMMKDEETCYNIESDVLDLLFQNCEIIERIIIENYIKNFNMN